MAAFNPFNPDTFNHVISLNQSHFHQNTQLICEITQLCPHFRRRGHLTPKSTSLLAQAGPSIREVENPMNQGAVILINVCSVDVPYVM